MPEKEKKELGESNQVRGSDKASDAELKPATQVVERVIRIARVAKVVKGGKNFSFSALVVVGDGNGHVGVGLGKSNEVADAIKKGGVTARKSFIKINLRGSTIPHAIMAKYKASKVIMRPAIEGTGVIAGSSVRALCDALGIKNILTKCYGSKNPVNVVRAALSAFCQLRLAREG